MSSYTRKQPCNSCPYRMDAPRQLWSKVEFELLLENDFSELGVTYGCHKNDGHICVGFLMDQCKRDLPSIMLRLSLRKNKVDRTYLDALHCKSEMFGSIEDMCEANYPGITQFF